MRVVARRACRFWRRNRLDAIARYFKFAERGTDLATEARAGVTTFLVMAYIIFLKIGRAHV